MSFETLTTCNYYAYGLPTPFWIGIGIGSIIFISLLIWVFVKQDEGVKK